MKTAGVTVAELARRVGGEARGDATRRIVSANALSAAGPTELAFFADPRYAADLQDTRAGCVLLKAEHDTAALGARIVVEAPGPAFAQLARVLHPPPLAPPGIDARAIVDCTAAVDPSAAIGAGAVIESEARIEAGAIIGPHAYVGREVHIGAGSRLAVGATVLDRCVVGARCVLGARSVIGSDGFGFQVGAEGRVRLPQIGVVVIEDEVEVGAGCTIDRATFGATVLRRGCKLDNLVHVAHNVEVGEGTVLLAQVGVSGSTTIGRRVILGGQVGVNGHIAIADDVVVGPKSGIPSSLSPGMYSGYPVVPHHEWRKQVAVQRNLYRLQRRVSQLERRLAEVSE